MKLGYANPEISALQALGGMFAKYIIFRVFEWVCSVGDVIVCRKGCKNLNLLVKLPLTTICGSKGGSKAERSWRVFSTVSRRCTK